MKAGWSLRKAWKLYQSSYSQISELYRQTFQLNLHNNSGNNSRRHDIPDRTRWSDENVRQCSTSSKDDIQYVLVLL